MDVKLLAVIIVKESINILNQDLILAAEIVGPLLAVEIVGPLLAAHQILAADPTLVADHLFVMKNLVMDVEGVTIHSEGPENPVPDLDPKHRGVPPGLNPLPLPRGQLGLNPHLDPNGQPLEDLPPNVALPLNVGHLHDNCYLLSHL